MQAGSATIAIIGGGFSGTVLAANLLRHPPAIPTRMVLFERRPPIGCGVAYAPHAYPFLLNVPAARMSATSYESAHLIEYARQRLPQADGDTYLTRQFYGEYLCDFLQAAERSAPRHVQFERVHGEVTALRTQRGRGPVRVLMGEQSWLADQVVLASGDPPPAVQPYAAEVAHLPSYVPDPYQEQPIKPGDRSVLLVGTGLTMVDVAVAAGARDPALRIAALSRHGRLPLTQPYCSRAPVLGAQLELCDLLASRSVPQVVAAVRRMVRNVQELGGDWREAITCARQCAPAVWQNLSEAERRRFLRHVRIYWEINRHRAPPEFASGVAAMRRTGQLAVHAGHIVQVQPEGDGIVVRWRPRGASQLRLLSIDRMIECSGSDRRLERTADLLWRQLLDAGLASPDPIGLGVRTGPHGALTDVGGRHSDQIFYLGPMLRATYGEATAVGELRVRAEALAAALAKRELAPIPAEPDAAASAGGYTAGMNLTMTDG